MEQKFLFLLILFFTGFNAKAQFEPEYLSDSIYKACDRYYLANKDDGSPSSSLGSTGKGTLLNGKLLPFRGSNFQYFDSRSYLAGRAFVHDRVKSALLGSYQLLDSIMPNRKFYIMECSNKEGGNFFPHRTHQNGLSVDFMMPLVKAGRTYTAIDTMGIAHYWLSFDNKGRYRSDTSILIDFENVARHILLLEEVSKRNGIHISKVIIKIELQDELFHGYYGQQLKKRNIYIVKSLTPKVNEMHDEHFHIDFEVLD